MGSTANILRKAKAHISDPSMWYQGGYSQYDLIGAIVGKPCCGLGAVAWVIGKNPLSHRSGYFLHDIADGDFGSFNDDPKTTHPDVMALFDRAIAKAETGE